MAAPSVNQASLSAVKPCCRNCDRRAEVALQRIGVALQHLGNRADADAGGQGLLLGQGRREMAVHEDQLRTAEVPEEKAVERCGLDVCNGARLRRHVGDAGDGRVPPFLVPRGRQPLGAEGGGGAVAARQQPRRLAGACRGELVEAREQ